MTSIAAERSALAAQGLIMRSREQWGAVFDYTSDRPCDVPAPYLFLHLAVVDPTSMDATQRTIERIGIDRFPATGYSYNAAVWPDGVLLEGQPLTRRGAHTINDFQRAVCPNHGGPLTAPSWNLNINARALVLPQNLQHAVTDAQVHSAARWAAAQKRSGYVTRDARWHGHRCVAAKSCPGDNGFARIPEIETLTEHYTVNGLEDDMPTADEIAYAVWNMALPDSLNGGEALAKWLLSGAHQGANRTWLVDVPDQTTDPDTVAQAQWVLSGIHKTVTDLQAAVAALVVDVDEEALAAALVAQGVTGGASPAQVKTALAEVLMSGTSSVPPA